MKKITQLVLATIIGIGATSFLLVEKGEPVHTPPVRANNTWFHTIQVADGIIVEFEYGSRLQVIVEENKNNISLEFKNHVLTAKAKSNRTSVKGSRIKVITPVLITLLSSRDNTHSNCDNLEGI